MKTSNRVQLYLKAGFFAVFFLIIFFILFLLIMLFNPAKDITDLVVDPPSGAVQDSTMPTTAPSASQTEPTEAKREEYTFDFKTDLSAYESYMNPEGDEYLTLINRDNRLGENYVPEDLVAVASTRKDGRATQQMREYAAKALEALFLEAEAQGMTYVNSASGRSLSVTSAYRSYAYQAQRLAEETANKGSEEAALKVVQYPGASEHQSGLCCDMHNLSSAMTSFESQDAAKWLAENCHKFGFILRYPKDKTEITGINFEPWHFRYVGRYHATKMQELDMCLEEYFEYLGK